jgi:ATP-dependent protease Clp ATPase subunit
MLFKRRLICSFCGKTAAQVSKLVEGRRGYICDACAAEAHRIMSADDTSPGSPPAKSQSVRARVGTQLRRWLPRGLSFDPIASM